MFFSSDGFLKGVLVMWIMRPASSSSCGMLDELPPISYMGCGTCHLRCGLTNRLSGRTAFCSCDMACLVFDDCCWDFQSECPEEFINASRLIDTFRPLPETLCVDISDSRENFQFVQQCVDSGELCRYNISASLDLDYGIPALDIYNGVHYINVQCALCNGAHYLELATVEVKCGSGDLQPDEDGDAALTAEDMLSALETSGTCTRKYTFPQRPPRRCVPVRDFCPAQCDIDEIIDLCVNGSQSYIAYESHEGYHDHNETYRNIYCALCNLGSLNGTYCGAYIQPPRDPGFPIGSFSLSLLLDFNLSGGPSVGYITVVCNRDQVVLPSGTQCGDIVCPRGYTLHIDQCVAEVDSGWIVVYVEYHLLLLGGESACNSSLIMDFISEVRGGFFTSVLSVHTAVNDSRVIEPTVSLAHACQHTAQERIVVNLTMTYHGYNINVTEFWTRTGKDIILSVMVSWNVAMNFSYDEIIVNVADIEVIWTPDDINTTCAGVSFPINEFEIANGSYILKATGDHFTEDDIILLETTIILCYNGSQFGDSYLLFSPTTALGVTTIVLSVVSLVCLCVRLVLQCKSRHFHTLAGKMQCHLAASLALAICLLLATPFTSKLPIACAILASLKYYAYVVCFFWMACIAGDTCTAMRPFHIRTDSSSTRVLTRYACVSWLIPLFMAVMLYCLEYIDIPDLYKPHMGGSSCWFTKRYTLMIYFLPVVCTFALTNLIIFLVTVRQLRIAFQNAVAVQKTYEKKSEFLVYVKLFLLMGLTWVVGFLAVVLNTEWIWYIFVALNSSQGIYLFLAFVIDLHAILKTVRESCISSGFYSHSRSNCSPGQVKVTLDTRL